MELKRISAEAVPAALERAKHYRVLNEPNQAESICSDILDAAPGHQEALTVLVLALSDQFERRLASRFQRALEVLELLEGEYEQAYYEGIVYERRARAQLRRSGARVGVAARDALDRAMACYERAAELAAAENPDPAMRYNTCVRMIQERAELRATAMDTAAAPAMLE